MQECNLISLKEILEGLEVEAVFMLLSCYGRKGAAESQRLPFKPPKRTSLGRF